MAILGLTKSKTPKRYTWNSLGFRCIRILEIDKGYTGENEPLRGDLKVVSLDHDANFEALSYSWGDVYSSCQIICSGTSIPITKNCHDALTSLLRNSMISKIWVDAICINQSDDAEKSRQIPLMCEIYGRATRVYIWLGNSTEDSDYAFEWLMEASYNRTMTAIRIMDYFPILNPEEAKRMIRLLLQVASRAIKSLVPRKGKLAYRPSAMQDLVSRDWFKRMWTVQELVMATEPIAVCGNNSIPWNYLALSIIQDLDRPESRGSEEIAYTISSVVAVQWVWLTIATMATWKESPVRTWLSLESRAYRPWQRFLDFLQNHGYAVGKSQIFFGLATIIYRIYWGLERPLNSWMIAISLWIGVVTVVLTPYDLSQNKRDWERRIREDLLGMLNRIRTYEATNPLDKVFALHGVFQKIGIALKLKPPDYTKSVGEVYHEFTTQLIKWHGSLLILFEASNPGIQGVPSWVPDLSKRHYRIIGSISSQIRAAGNSVPDFSFLNDSEGPTFSDDMASPAIRRIQTKGKIIDRMVSCTLKFQEPDANKVGGSKGGSEDSSLFLHNLRVVRQWLLASQEALSQVNQSDYDNFEALFKLMHCEIDFNSYMAPNEAELRRNFRRSIEIFNSVSGDKADRSSAQVWTKTLRENGTLEYLFGRYNAIAGRRILFTTEEGRLGTGPVSMSTDDVVALLAGFSGAMVLRRREMGYEIIGVAYVGGVMEGQAWPEEEKDMQQLDLI